MRSDRAVWTVMAMGTIFLLAVACGGVSKPPMVPDAPDPAVAPSGDAGAQPARR